MDSSGFPLEVHAFEGNKAETGTIVPVLDAFRDRHGVTELVVVADAGMLSAGNLAAVEDAGYRFIVGSRTSSAPCDLADHYQRHGNAFTDGQIIETTRTMGHGSNARQRRVVWQYSFKREKRDNLTLNKQIQRAEKIADGSKPMRRDRFVTVDGTTVGVNWAQIEKARTWLGLKGYVTNIPEPVLDGAGVVAAYHSLFQVEASFRMAKSDLRARPMFHHERDSIEAHLTIVFCALAISRHLHTITGYTIRRTVRALRPRRDIDISVDGHQFTATTPPEGQATDILTALQRPQDICPTRPRPVAPAGPYFELALTNGMLVSCHYQELLAERRWCHMRATFGRRLAAVAAVTVAAVILTSCSGSGGSATDKGGTPAVSNHAPSSITVAFAGPMSSLDPLIGSGLQDINALGLFGEGLYEFSYGHNSNPQPGLAESAKTSADQLTWTFTLRPDLKFSDGTPLTAADVKATLDRARTDPESAWTSFAAPLTGIDAPDPSTIVIHVSRPYPNLPTILAESGFAIFPASAASKGKSYWSDPISAGPYKLKAAWDGGPNLTLTRNPYYWGKAPVIKDVHFTTITDFNTAVSQLRTGQIDMVQGLPMSVQPTLAAAKGIQWNLVQTYGVTGFPMNNQAAPFNEPNVRKAVSLALDRDQMNKVAWRGLGKPLSSFWPSTMTGYDASISTKQNLGEAKKLLKGTACAAGCSVTLAYNAGNGGWASQLAQIAASDLAKIGIKVQVSQLGDTQWSNNVVSASHYQLAVTYIYDFANIPDGMLEYSATTSSYFRSFYSGWSDPQLAGAVEKALEANGGQRKAAYAEINRLFEKDVPYATVATYNDLWAQRVSSKFIDAERTDQIAIARVG